VPRYRYYSTVRSGGSAAVATVPTVGCSEKKNGRTPATRTRGVKKQKKKAAKDDDSPKGQTDRFEREGNAHLLAF